MSVNEELKGMKGNNQESRNEAHGKEVAFDTQMELNNLLASSFFMLSEQVSENKGGKEVSHWKKDDLFIES